MGDIWRDNFSKERNNSLILMLVEILKLMRMRKIISDILFSLVLGVITLHAVIPHPHSNELTEEEHFEIHKNADSLVGFLRLTFHESDDDTLDNPVVTQNENIKTIEGKHINSTASFFYSSLLIIENAETAIAPAWKTDNFIKLLIVKPNGLRGPPQSI